MRKIFRPAILLNITDVLASTIRLVQTHKENVVLIFPTKLK